MRRVPVAALALACAVAGCGGGGANGPAHVPAAGGNPPAAGAVNPLTTYAVSIGTDALGQSALDLTAYGTQTALGAADLAPGAVAVYPDGSTQTADAQGYVDASQSTYGRAVRAQFVADANRAPQVVVYANDGLVGAQTGTPFPTAGTANPAVANVLPYQSRVSAASAPLAIAVTPNAATLFGGDGVTLSATVRTVEGDLTSGGGASIAWSLAKPAGCGFPPAGSVVQSPNDPSKARYVAPATGGDFSASCPDLVVVTASALGATVATSAAMHSYDKATAAQIAGTLAAGGGGPFLGGALVLFDGLGADAYGGTLAARTASGGGFRARVPFYRTLRPAAYAPAGGAYELDGVAPSSLSPQIANGLSSQQWTTTGRVAPPPPVPDVVTPLADALTTGRIARDPFPFDGPPSAPGPAYPPGSLASVVHGGAAGSSGTIVSGAYTGFTYAVSADNKTVYASLGTGQNVMLVVGRQPDGSFTFARWRLGQFGSFDPSNPSTAGARLEADGGWTESVGADGTWSATLRRNDYLPAQSAGSPYETHAIAAHAPVGGATLTFTDQVTSASGAFVGTMTGTRNAGAGTTLYTYGATLARTYHAGFGDVTVTYAVGDPNGGPASEHVDATNVRFGDEAISIASSPSAAEQGATLDLRWLSSAQGESSANVMTGTVASPALAPVLGGPVATFSADIGGALTGAYATAYGAQTFALTL